jgi:hypothetical protein
MRRPREEEAMARKVRPPADGLSFGWSRGDSAM